MGGRLGRRIEDEALSPEPEVAPVVGRLYQQGQEAALKLVDNVH